MGITAYHELTATTPDDPAAEVQMKHWNSAHLITVSLLAAAEFVGGFSNANGISFGDSAGKVTASYTVPTQSVQTQASGGIAGSGFTSTTIAGTEIEATQNSAGLSMAVPAYITTYAAQSVQTQASGAIPRSGFTTTTIAGAVVAGTHNTDGLLVAVPAYLTTAQSVGAYLTTARASNDAVGLATALTANGVAWTVNSAGLSLNVPAYLTTAQAPGAYLTTARASTDALGLGTAGTNMTWTANSAGLSINAAGYAGTGTSATNASVTLNSNGLAISVAAPGGGGAALSGFEPFHLAGVVTTAFVPAIGSWYFQPFVAPAPLASGRLNVLVSYSNSNGGVLRASNGASFASNTTGTRSISYVLSDKMALYSRGAGANSTRLESFWSNTWSIGIMESVSVILTAATHVRASLTVSVSYIASVGSNGGYTTSLVSGSGSFSSGATAWGTSLMSSLISSALNVLSGQMLVPMGFDTSVPAGMYWLAQQWSTASTTGGTSVQDVLPFVNQLAITGISSMPYRPFGATVSDTSSQFWPGAGVYSAASAVPPPTVPLADIRSIASHLTQYFNHINIPS